MNSGLAETLIAAKSLGIDSGKVVVSRKLQWIVRDGKLSLCKASVDHSSGKVTLYADAIRARDEDVFEVLKEIVATNHDIIDSQADGAKNSVASIVLSKENNLRVRTAVLVFKEFDESEHPRDEDGKFTFGGGGGSDTDSGSGYGDSKSKSPAADLLASNHDDDMTIDQVKNRLSSEFHDEAKKAEEEMKGMEITSVKYTGSDGKYVQGRASAHSAILRQMFTPEVIAASVPKAGEKPVLTLSGGRPGAGKTTSLEKELAEKLKTSFYISADDIQAKLPGYKGRHAGIYNSEAQDIALQAEKVARHMGLNIIYDATLKSKQPALERTLNYKAAGYDVDGYFVHTTPAMSALRSADRFMNDKDNLGRYLPPESSFNNRTSESTFDSLIPHLRNWALYDNNGAKPIRIAGSK